MSKEYIKIRKLKFANRNIAKSIDEYLYKTKFLILTVQNL